jgi:hypothetical protein
MNRKNREKLADRIGRAAETALAAQHYVSPIDVLVGIGWLDRGTVDRWRRGQIEYLERVIQTNLARVILAVDRGGRPFDSQLCRTLVLCGVGKGRRAATLG